MTAGATGPDAIRLELFGGSVESLWVVTEFRGVAVRFAAGLNGPGVGRLRSTGDGTALSWRAPGSATFGVDVDCSADGEYVLCDGEDPDKYVRLEVWAAHLSPGSAAAAVVLRDVFGNAVGYSDVAAAEAAAGDVATYTITVRNASAAYMHRVLFWLDPSVVDLEISPNGSAWSAPTTEATAITLGDLAPGATATLHLRRTISVGADSDPDILNLLQYSCVSIF
ncbi:MAG: DUF11 domain-containing protein [bacterium]|nr:DUF11 domain-containing protein [bacterium]